MSSGRQISSRESSSFLEKDYDTPSPIFRNSKHQKIVSVGLSKSPKASPSKKVNLASPTHPAVKSAEKSPNNQSRPRNRARPVIVTSAPIEGARDVPPPQTRAGPKRPPGKLASWSKQNTEPGKVAEDPMQRALGESGGPGGFDETINFVETNLEDTQHSISFKVDEMENLVIPINDEPEKNTFVGQTNFKDFVPSEFTESDGKTLSKDGTQSHGGYPNLFTVNGHTLEKEYHISQDMKLFPSLSDLHLEQLKTLYAFLDSDEDDVVSVEDLFDFFSVHQQMIMPFTAAHMHEFISSLETVKTGNIKAEPENIIDFFDSYVPPSFPPSSARTFRTSELQHQISMLLNIPYKLGNRRWWELDDLSDTAGCSTVADFDSMGLGPRAATEYSIYSPDSYGESNNNVYGSLSEFPAPPKITSLIPRFLTFETFCKLYNYVIYYSALCERSVYTYEEDVKKYFIERAAQDSLHDDCNTLSPDSPVTVMYGRIIAFSRVQSFFYTLAYFYKHGLTSVDMRSGACIIALKTRLNLNVSFEMRNRKAQSLVRLRHFKDHKRILSILRYLFGYVLERNKKFENFYEYYCLQSGIIWNESLCKAFERIHSFYHEACKPLPAESPPLSSQSTPKHLCAWTDGFLFSPAVETSLLNLFPYLSLARRRLHVDGNTFSHYAHAIVAVIVLAQLWLFYAFVDYFFTFSDGYYVFAFCAIVFLYGCFFAHRVVNAFLSLFSLLYLGLDQRFPINERLMMDLLSRVKKVAELTDDLNVTLSETEPFAFNESVSVRRKGELSLEAKKDSTATVVMKKKSANVYAALLKWCRLYNQQYLDRRNIFTAYLFYIEETEFDSTQLRTVKVFFSVMHLCSMLSAVLRVIYTILVVCFFFYIKFASPFNEVVVGWRLSMLFLAEQLADDYLSICFERVRQFNVPGNTYSMYHMSPLLIRQLFKVKYLFQLYVSNPSFKSIYNPMDVFFERVLAHVHIKNVTLSKRDPNANDTETEKGDEEPQLVSTLLERLIPTLESDLASLPRDIFSRDGSSDPAALTHHTMVSKVKDLLTSLFPSFDFNGQEDEKAPLNPTQLAILGADSNYYSSEDNAEHVSSRTMHYYTPLVKRRITLFAMILSLLSVQPPQERDDFFGSERAAKERISRQLSLIIPSWFINSNRSAQSSQDLYKGMSAEIHRKEQKIRSHYFILQVQKMEKMQKMFSKQLYKAHMSRKELDTVLDTVSVARMLNVLSDM